MEQKKLNTWAKAHLSSEYQHHDLKVVAINEDKKNICANLLNPRLQCSVSFSCLFSIFKGD